MTYIADCVSVIPLDTRSYNNNRHSIKQRDFLLPNVREYCYAYNLCTTIQIEYLYRILGNFCVAYILRIDGLGEVRVF